MPFGSQLAYQAPWDDGLHCEKCKRSGMRPLRSESRHIAERFAGRSLDKIEPDPSQDVFVAELRDAALNWIEHHVERKIATRSLLETP
jgi:hypothetical protein